MAGQESKITAIKVSGPTAEVAVSRKEGKTSSQLIKQGDKWLITGKEATAPQTKLSPQELVKKNKTELSPQTKVAPQGSVKDFQAP